MSAYKRSSAAVCLLLVAACGTPTQSPVTGPSPTASYSRLIGALNPDVTQATIRTTICVTGWTKKVRPTLPTRKGFEHDHVIPLELGGAPRDPDNLWFEPLAAARKGDVVENRLHREVCAGKLSLGDAQREIVAWKRSHG